MNSGAGDTTQLVPGFPIRTPWDHSSVDSSPRPIAASHVLHRLLVPRHPPTALSNLTTKMLASTVQFSTNNHPHPPARTTPPHRRPSTNQAQMTIPNTPPPPEGTSCSFRTQQGASIHHLPTPTTPPFPTPPRKTPRPGGTRPKQPTPTRGSASVSAVEQPPPHPRRRRAPTRTPTGPGGAP